jgi:hypothetical protein
MVQELERNTPTRRSAVALARHPMRRLIVALAMLALFAGQARAGLLGDAADWITGKSSVPGVPSDAACNRYADEAVALAAQNEQFGCRFGGPRYGKDRRAHFNWCKMQTTRGEHQLGEAAESESRWREYEIGRCSSLCKPYADEANARARDNQTWHCGFTGPRWGVGRGHFQYCMGVEHYVTAGPFGLITGTKLLDTFDGLKGRFLDPETAARDQAINQCKARFTPTQVAKCTEYANKAMEQVKHNTENFCGGIGGRWSGDWNDHFAFCTWGWQHDIDGRDIVTAMKDETEIRDSENKRCDDSPIDYGGSTRPDGGGGPLKPIQSSGASPPGGIDQINVGSPGASGLSTVIDRPNPIDVLPGTSLPRPPAPAPIIVSSPTRLPPTSIPEGGSNRLPPVITPRMPSGGGPSTSLPSGPLPTGSSGLSPVLSEATKVFGALKHRLPPDILRPKGPSGMPPPLPPNGTTNPSRLPPSDSTTMGDVLKNRPVPIGPTPKSTTSDGPIVKLMPSKPLNSSSAPMQNKETRIADVLRRKPLSPVTTMLKGQTALRPGPRRRR